MSLNHINDLESGISVRSKLNDTVDQVNTNVTNITTNTSDIATNVANIATKQTINSASTVHDIWDDSITGNYTLLATDKNNIKLITNSGATTFTLPPTGTIAAFLTGDKVIVINSDASAGNIVLTAGAGVTLRVGGFSATLTAGQSAWVVKTGANAYRRIL